MTKEEFREKYCNVCGSRRCYGVDDPVFRDDCGDYRREFKQTEGITEQDLIDLGWMPQECKIGTLYFGYPFFCRLVDGIAYIYHTKNDTQLIGKATKMTEIRGIQKKYFEDDTNSLASLLYLRRKATAKNFGKCEFEYGPEIRAFKRVIDKMYENFDPAHDWVQEFKNSLDIEYENTDKEKPED